MNKKQTYGCITILVICILLGGFKQQQYVKTIFSKDTFLNKIKLYSFSHKVLPRVKSIDETGVLITELLYKIKNKISFKGINFNKKIISYKYQSFLNQRKDQFKEIIKSNLGIQSNSKDVTYMVNLMPAWKGICRDSLDLLPPTPRYDIISGIGEWESLQLALTPIEHDIDSVYIELIKWPFTKKPQLFWGEYVFCKYSINHKKDVTVQDLLIPMYEDKEHFVCELFPTKILKDSTKSVFINFDFSSSQLIPGNYLAEIEIHTFNKGIENEIYTIPIDIEISKFRYPKKKRLKTLISYTYEWSYWYYGSQEYVEKLLDNHFNVLSEYRIHPMQVFPNNMKELPNIKQWPNLYDKGARTFMLGQFHTNGRLFIDNLKIQNEMLNSLKAKEAILIENKLINNSYIFLYDELIEDRKKLLIETAKILKANGIKSKLYATTLWVPPTQLIDAWCPLLQVYDNHVEEFDLGNFKERWVYTCNTTLDEKYGNFFTDIPPIKSRQVFWNLHERGIDYFQYYSINRWDRNISEEKSGARPIHKILNKKKGTVSWNTRTYRQQNGDGQLFYPGDNGDLWPSVRALNYRDGSEDYELFYQKKEKIKSVNMQETLNKRTRLLKE